jgi:hypothetical protein
MPIISLLRTIVAITKKSIDLKTRCFLLLPIACIVIANTGQAQSDLTKRGLCCHVKAVVTSHYDRMPNDTFTLNDKQVSVFDTSGNLMETWESDDSGHIELHTIYRHDTTRALKIEIIEDSLGTMRDSIVFKLDHLERETATWYYSKDRALVQRTEVTISANNPVQNIVIYDGHDRVVQRATATLNQAGLTESWSNYAPNDTKLNEIQYKYDEKGNRIQSDLYDPATALLESHHYVYDDNHNILEETRTSRSNRTTTTVNHYTFDAAGNWVELTQNINEKYSSITRRLLSYY